MLFLAQEDVDDLLALKFDVFLPIVHLVEVVDRDGIANVKEDPILVLPMRTQ